MSEKDDKKKKTLSPLQGVDPPGISLQGPTLADAGLDICTFVLQSSC